MSYFDSQPKPAATDRELSLPILAKILETMREAVIVFGSNTRVLISNSSAFNAFSKNESPLENKRISEIFRDLTLHEAFRKALESDESTDLALEFPGIRDLKFDVHIAPIKIDDSKCAVGVFYDISKIERLEKVRQEFLSNISHELRTPLTSILAFVETLENGAIDDAENGRRFLATIRKNAEKMRLLINDILELSSIESGKIGIDRKSVNLSSMIDEIFAMLSAEAKVHSIKLINQISADVKVFCDLAHMEQMLTNLIDNAIKFNRQGGAVKVSYSRDSDFDVISVEDTGEGISDVHLERVFERFYRTSRARSQEISGTGLGLAIVKHLAKLHGGKVSVRSKPGEGSTFLISTPISPQ